ncbi:MAG: ABC transporter permease [Phycisphaerales bacterium]|nr:ABC transporter permease [Phycisphaerales bacterium]
MSGTTSHPFRSKARARAARFLHLLFTLTARDLKVRYKQSLLGVLWAVLVPLSMMLVFAAIVSRGGVTLRGDLGMPYPVYAYVGLTAWGFFSSSLSACATSLTANRTLVTKVYFPREAFPLSAVLGPLVDWSIAVAVGFLLITFTDPATQWNYRPGAGLLLLPVVIAPLAALTAGLGMIVAMGQLFYRDVKPVLSVALQLGLFVSGVVFPVPRDDSWIACLMRANPLTVLVGAHRTCMVEGRIAAPSSFVVVSAFSVGALWLGWLAFRKAAHRFAECI